MPESKSGALPLGDAPTGSTDFARAMVGLPTEAARLVTSCLPTPRLRETTSAAGAAQVGRRERIRTSGPHVPNVVLYQAELLSAVLAAAIGCRFGRQFREATL
jgi:hypothetical protein